MRRVALLLFLLAAPAWAQMDPRNASGIARPDADTPVGTLMVAVLQGEMTRHVVGVPVTLVSVRPDGTIATDREVTDDSGHVAYSNLQTNGETTYYVFALLGDDRLESDGVNPDPTSGMKMLLAGRKLGVDGKPTGDPIDDDHQEGAPAVPNGQIQIVLRGHLPPGQELVLHEAGGAANGAVVARTTAQAVPKAKDEDDDKLLATFSGLPTGPDHIYYAEMIVNGRTFRTHPTMLSDLAGSMRGVLIVNQLLFSMRGGAELDDDRLGFQLQLNLLNGTGVPWDLGPSGLTVPLPVGFHGANTKDDSFGDRVSVNEEGVHFRGVIPPGSHSTIVSFTLPQSGGAVNFDMPVPYGIYDSTIFVEKAAGAEIDTEGKLPQLDVRKMDDGRDFYSVGNWEMQPGQSVSFRVLNLPEPSQAQAVARVMAGLFVLGFIVWILIVVLGPAPASASPLKLDRLQLEARRERLFGELEAMSRRGVYRVDEAQRVELVQRIALITRELEIGGGAGGSKKARRAS